MAMVLCLDDFTCELAEAAQVLRDNGYAVLVAEDNASALEIAYATHVDAVLLNCRRDKENAGLVTALRMLQPQAAVVRKLTVPLVPAK